MARNKSSLYCIIVLDGPDGIEEMAKGRKRGRKGSSEQKRFVSTQMTKCDLWSENLMKDKWQYGCNE